jgi:hypothetical protein
MSKFISGMLVLGACLLASAATAGTTISFEVGSSYRNDEPASDLDIGIEGRAGREGSASWQVSIIPKGGKPPYEFAIEPEPKVGMTFDAGTGTIAGGVVPAGVFDYVVAVRDSLGAVASADLAVVAREDPAPAVTTMTYDP